MARVSSEQLKRLQAFFDTLPAEQKGKCALCNETLVHVVKQAEAEVGVGTATVTRVLAEKVNETARLLNEVEEPLDVQTCRALSQFIAPGTGSKKTGPKQDLAALLGRHFEAAEIYGEQLKQIGQPGGPRSVTDAKERASGILGCVVRTLDKYIEPPFDIVVAWARDGIPPEAIGDEENAKIRMDFYAKHQKK